jgi:thiamine biosynthesis lipoprotein
MELLFSEQLAMKLTHPAMGTIMTHQAYGEGADECLTAVQMEIERLEALFSRFLPGSDISRINQNAGINVVPISEETLQILQTARQIADNWPQLFDITITPLVNLWRQAAQRRIPPSQQTIIEALQLVNHQDLLLNPVRETAGLRKTGQSLDLGGIAKGYAANRLRDCYRAFGIHSAFSNLGGNVVALGCKPNGSPWRIGIQHPRLEQQLLGVVSIENEAVVTSGDYQRYFIGTDGKRYHHIIDPQTGYPSTSDLISVTIVAKDAMLADILSTLLFISGLQKGIQILSHYPECEVVLVDQNCQIFISKGLCDRFTPVSSTQPTILSPNGVFSE